MDSTVYSNIAVEVSFSKPENRSVETSQAEKQREGGKKRLGKKKERRKQNCRTVFKSEYTHCQHTYPGRNVPFFMKKKNDIGQKRGSL